MSINLSILNEPQQRAVLHNEGPLLILAGAGSGKTRVITYRIARLVSEGVSPWNILAMTFTNKAAAQMRERLRELVGSRAEGVWVSTFHSFGAQFLRTEAQRLRLDRNFTIYDDDDQKRVVKDCLKELGIDDKQFAPSMIVNRISREKDQLMDAKSFEIAALAAADPTREMIADVYNLYQKKLDASGALDFGDLLLKTVEGLKSDGALCAKYQERFRFLLVDEYQDTNRAQYVLTKLLAARHKNICVVGDDDQSIYSWRGADLRNILDFEKDYPNVTVVKLEQNYRSTQPILDAAWRLIQNNEQRKEKRLWTEQKEGEAIEVLEMGSEREESKWIAERVLELRETQRMALGQMSVLYRTNAQSRVLEDALREHNIPYRIVGSVRFYERAEVKDVLAYLKLIANPKDDISLKRILNVPTRGLGKTTQETITRAAAARGVSFFEILSEADQIPGITPRARAALGYFHKMISEWCQLAPTLPISAMLESVLAKTHLLDILKEEAKTQPESVARVENVEELVSAVKEFEERSENKTLSAYLEEVVLLTDVENKADTAHSLTLMTVHVAKGLEFDAVFLTGLEEGLFPLGEAQFDRQELEEERRLCYVGMTRARKKLHLTLASSRKIYGTTRWNNPSRFIEEAGLTLRMKSTVADSGMQSSEFQPRAPIAAQSFTTQEPTHPAYRIGARVKHAEFGWGRIKESSGSGDDLKVTVQFDSGAWKKLLVKYAPLSTR